MKTHTNIPLLELVAKYCKTQEAEPIDIMGKLQNLKEAYHPTGFMLLRCVQLDSSRLGNRVILPFGSHNTYKEPPDRPISPTGMSSDMSEVECIHILQYDSPQNQ